jgi:molybdenum cofactor cytidylyltransferase
MRLMIAILAAGASRRFGPDNKLEAIWHGKPLIQYAAATLHAIPAFRHVAICRPEDHLLQKILSKKGFEIRQNSDPDAMQSESFRNAVSAAIEYEAEALLIALGDMPAISLQHYTALVSGLAHYPILSSRAHGSSNNMPPAAFRRSEFAGLLAATGDQGARSIIANAAFIEAPAQELRDFDLASDFNQR